MDAAQKSHSWCHEIVTLVRIALSESHMRPPKSSRHTARYKRRAQYLDFDESGRSERIRTSDPLYPKPNYRGGAALLRKSVGGIHVLNPA